MRGLDGTGLDVFRVKLFVLIYFYGLLGLHWTPLEGVLAEGEGFEPPVPFQAQRFSRPPVSTTHPSLRLLARADLIVKANSAWRRVLG